MGRMDEYWYRPPDGPLQRMNVGDAVTIDGVTKRVAAVTMRVAEEDDPELEVKAGDWTYEVEFA